ncbi:MAG: ATP-binding protein [Thermodesulfovibrio sp.]|nr:ATP-binding protein [Thermodesulfovibrio sp.]
MEVWIFISIFLIVVVSFLLIRIYQLSKISSKEITKIQRKINDRYQQDSLEHFETIIKSITDGLLIVDNKGYVSFANKSFKDIMKLDDPPEGKRFIEVIRNIDLINLLRKCIETKQEVKDEVIIKKLGYNITILAKAIPILDSVGKISFFILLLQDITRLKQLENLRTEFIANISHELKTPVTTIKSYTETLLEGAIEDRENLRKFIEIIKNQTDRLNALIEDLLTLSKIEYGEIKIEKEKLFLESMVDSVFQIFSDKAQKKGVYLKKDIPPHTVISADREKFLQILINLIDNAIKFTEKGGVTVRFYKEDSKGIISVEDTGIGIPKEHLHRIGERFYRVDKARSRLLGGTGLGLAIVKHLVSAHGWQLKIESEVGVGTKVKIMIPSE